MKNSSVVGILLMALMMVSGCQNMGTRKSRQGGVSSTDKEFSITVPKFNTVKQGGNTAVTVSLNRGAYFKRDVQLDIQADGINVTPKRVEVKASEKPDVQLQIDVPQDAAIGEYRVVVKATPETGDITSTEFIVKVTIAQ